MPSDHVSSPCLSHREKAAVIVPLDRISEFFADMPSYALNNLVHYWARTSLRDLSQPDNFRQLQNTCRLAWRANDARQKSHLSSVAQLSGECYMDVMKAAILRDEIYFFGSEVAWRHGGNLSMDFFKWVRTWIENSAEEQGMARLVLISAGLVMQFPLHKSFRLTKTTGLK